MTIMGIVANRMEMDLTGMTGEVKKGMAADPRPVARHRGGLTSCWNPGSSV